MHQTCLLLLVKDVWLYPEMLRPPWKFYLGQCLTGAIRVLCETLWQSLQSVDIGDTQEEELGPNTEAYFRILDRDVWRRNKILQTLRHERHSSEVGPIERFWTILKVPGKGRGRTQIQIIMLSMSTSATLAWLCAKELSCEVKVIAWETQSGYKATKCLRPYAGVSIKWPECLYLASCGTDFNLGPGGEFARSHNMF